MAELMGLILGVAGGLQQAHALLVDLKTRCRAVSSHQSEAAALLEEFRFIRDFLVSLHPRDTDLLSPGERALVHKHLTDLTAETATAVRALEVTARRMRSALYRFRKKDKSNSVFGALADTAFRFHAIINQLATLLAVVRLPEQLHLHRAAAVDTASSASALPSPSPSPSASSSARSLPMPEADCFCPSFATEVNDRPLALDFTSQANGHYVTAEARLKALLLSGSSPHAGGAAACGATQATEGGPGVFVVGPGGVGKSCALRAIAQCAETRERFPGGVFFRSLGGDASILDVVTMIADFVEASGGRLLAAEIRASTLPTAITKAAMWFADRVFLLVVDDVWLSNDVSQDLFGKLAAIAGDPLGRPGRLHSCIVYSTRDRNLGGAATARTVEFRNRDVYGHASRAMLLKAARLDAALLADEQCEVHLRELLALCGGLPFTLNLAGRLLCEMKQELGIDDMAEAWMDCVSALRDAESLLNQPQESYYSSIASSLRFLSGHRPVQEVSYEDAVRAFCVLKRQDWVPLTVCAHLWGGKAVGTVDRVVRNLASLGIVDMESRNVAGKRRRGLRFHDHIHSYAKSSILDDTDSTALFVRLTKSYETSFSSDREGHCWPAQVEHDGYSVENICRFLAGAGRLGCLQKTLCSGQWVTRMMAMRYTNQFDRDVRLLMKGDGNRGRNEPKEHRHVDPPVKIPSDYNEQLKILKKIISIGQGNCKGSVHAAWFQLHARLQSAEPKEQWMLDMMKEADVFSTKPRVRPLSPCLEMPSEAFIGLQLAGSRVRDAVYSPTVGVITCFSSEEDDRVHICVQSGQTNQEPTTKYMLTASLDGKAEEVRALWYSFGNNSIASGHKDGKIRVWDVDTGLQKCAPLEGHSKHIAALAMNDSASILLSGSNDCTLRVWSNIGTNTSCTVLTGHSLVVNCVALSGNGHRAASGSADKTVRIWNTQNGQQIGASLVGHSRSVRCIAMSRNGEWICSGSTDKSVRLWNANRGEPVGASIGAHKGRVHCVLVTNDGRRIISGSEDRTIRIWNTESGKQVGSSLAGHSHFVDSLRFGAEDESTIVSGSRDKTARVWRIDREESAGSSIARHKGLVICLEMSNDGKLMVSGSTDATAQVWTVETGIKFGPPLVGHHNSIHCLCFSHDSKSVVTGSVDKTVRVWDVDTGQQVGRSLIGHERWVSCVGISRNALHIVSGSADKTVRVWDVDRRQQVGEPLAGHPSLITKVSINENGTMVVSGSENCSVRVWNVGTGACIKSISVDKDSFRSAFFRMCNEYLDIAVPQQEVEKPAVRRKSHQITMKVGERAKVVAAFDHDIWRMETSPCGRYIATGFPNGVVSVLKVEK